MSALKITILGCGSSFGVPLFHNIWGKCDPKEPKNIRSRPSILVQKNGKNLLIDTSPDLKQQFLNNKIDNIDAVFYTHEHADHIFGMDDLRLFQFYLGHAVPVYCEPNVEQRLRQSFDYAFSDRKQTHRGSIPQLSMNTISTAPFEVLGTKVIPIRLYHGPRFKVLGFRIGNIAYCTDTNEIPEQSWPLLEGLDCLILDALRRKPHATHFGLDEAVEVAKKIGAKRTVFTHISHDLEHEQTNKDLPDSMELAYDGMQLTLS